VGWFGVEGEDGERLKNLMIFKVYATDKEMDEMTPIFLLLAVVGLIAWAVIHFFF
jgi:hypothetical protein